MRITKLAVVAVGLTLGLAACTSSGSSESATPESATPSASGSGSSTASGSGSGGSTGGVANSCVVGNWKSNGVNATFDSNGVHGSTTGGGGLVVRVSRDGKTVLDFTSMQPVTFSTVANGTEIKGSFVYGGTVTGKVEVSDAATTKGTWRPVGAVDWRNTTVTVDLISPVQSRIFDHAKIADFASAGGGQTGGTVDVQPILREMTYECTASTLTLGPPAGVTGVGTWVLARA